MPTVLITGCSSGIGRATAERLARRGFDVWATARRLDGIADLASQGCHTLALDVTDERSMSAAVAAIQEAGGLDALVNNAGYSQSGAIETVPMEAVRRQFETNVFGLVRLTQLALPGMRARGRGRIVNISSMGGKLTYRRVRTPRLRLQAWGRARGRRPSHRASAHSPSAQGPLHGHTFSQAHDRSPRSHDRPRLGQAHADTVPPAREVSTSSGGPR